MHGGRVAMFSLTMTPRMRKASVAIRCTSKLKRRLDASSPHTRSLDGLGVAAISADYTDAANNNSIEIGYINFIVRIVNPEISKICIDSFIETVSYHFHNCAQ